MRITRLDLTRYGKFTDKSVALPKAEQDFHFIVGPNEAGKSTLRDAIQDLLFGIKTRSRYNFLHAYSDMQLGALLEQDDRALELVRTKAQRNALRTPAGDPLPESALVPFLGQIERTYFDQMFGLNHQRLVEGGKEILSAASDIGRILFQAAAGIDSLGAVRKDLEQQADQLWGKKGASRREYTQASDELDQARAELTQATVRTRDWQEASRQVANLTEAHNAARTRHAELERQHSQLERVRRVAPILAALTDTGSRLAALGQVIGFDGDASQTLAQASQDRIVAAESLRMIESSLAELKTRHEAQQPDTAVLHHAEAIQSLTRQRGAIINHERDIGQRQEELRVHWQAVLNHARSLGWTETDEAILSARLPNRLDIVAMRDLISRHELLVLRLDNAADDIRTHENALAAISHDLAALPPTAIPGDLREAKKAAEALGDVTQQQQRLDAGVERLTQELDNARLELGEWSLSTDELKGMALPSMAEIADLVQRRAALEQQATHLADQLGQTRTDCDRLQLEIRQFRDAHQPVTLADVLQQRAVRDSLWQTIKAGQRPLGESAGEFEQQTASADAMSDQRHDKARQAADLQSLTDRLEQLQQLRTDIESRSHHNSLALADLDQTWCAEMQRLGLPGMPLLRLDTWRNARTQVLKIMATLQEARNTRQQFLDNVATARAALAAILTPLPPPFQEAELPRLIGLADNLLTETDRATERRRLLENQQLQATTALRQAVISKEEAEQALSTWQSGMLGHLARVHLPADATVSTLQEALAVFDDMGSRLGKMRELRQERIDPMRRDLDDFATAARALAQRIDLALASADATVITQELDQRLKQAEAIRQEQLRLQTELTKANADAQQYRERIATAQASLTHLLQRLPPEASEDDLRLAIQRSDQHRELTLKHDQLSDELIGAGDGLDRSQLEQESAGTDVNAIPGQLTLLKEETGSLINEQNRLSSELSTATTALGQIAGQAEAARAENRRQEALARMANAAERFIRVHTASRLLGWSIERFRENRQEPLLQRASEIFRGLTQGMFERLDVDYDQNPMTLSGRRNSGSLVGIEGMSEGTRDQLFLALRLAALELHLEQTPPLPFIADDLFINYDDGRSRAGFEALATLSRQTQVIFLSHHHHLVPVAESVFGQQLNVVDMMD